MKKYVVFLMVIVGLFLVVMPANAGVIYSNDFENLSDLLTEWSYSSTNTTPGTAEHPSDRFLGEFGSSGQISDNVMLTLSGLPVHTMLTITFDLYCLKSWDGNGNTIGTGPDEWDLRVFDGPILLHSTFSNEDSYNHQAFPDAFPGGVYTAGTGALEVDTLGYSFQLLGDSVYRLNFIFPHSLSSVIFEFSSDLTVSNSTNDETWGIDNVVVTPEPATVLLLGLGGLVLRRKHRA